MRVTQPRLLIVHRTRHGLHNKVPQTICGTSTAFCLLGQTYPASAALESSMATSNSTTVRKRKRVQQGCHGSRRKWSGASQCSTAIPIAVPPCVRVQLKRHHGTARRHNHHPGHSGDAMSRALPPRPTPEAVSQRRAFRLPISAKACPPQPTSPICNSAVNPETVPHPYSRDLKQRLHPCF